MYQCKIFKAYLCQFLNIAWQILYFVGFCIVFIIIILGFFSGGSVSISDLPPAKINFNDIPEADFWKVIALLVLIIATITALICMSIAYR